MDSLIEPEEQLSQKAIEAPWGEYGRSATLGVVSLFSKAVLLLLNSTTITGADIFEHHTVHRPPGTGLITVSNHTSTIDDPFLISTIIPWSFFWTEHSHHGNRWSICAKEICYKNWLLGQFFSSGKTLPIERGAGIEQPVMQIVAREVSKGGWLHIFPEGKVVRTGMLGPLRWGVGRVICDATIHSNGQPPVVLPFYHTGMGDVLPAGATIPRAGKEVEVVVGGPIADLDMLTCRCGKEGEDQAQVWKDITKKIEIELKRLEEQVRHRNKDQTSLKGRKGEKARRKSLGEGGALPLD